MQLKPRVQLNQLLIHPRRWKGNSLVCVHPPHPRPTARAKAQARTRTITDTITNRAARAAAVVVVADIMTAKNIRAVTNRLRIVVIKILIQKTKTRNVQKAKVIHTQKAAAAVVVVVGGIHGTAAQTIKARKQRVEKRLQGAARL